MDFIDVAIGVLKKDGRICLSQRQKHQTFADKWEFPGGKVEKGESVEAALIREFKEELNIDTQQLELYNYRNQRQTIVSQPFKGQLLAQASNFNYCYVLTESALYAFNIYGSALWKEAADGVTQVVQHNNSILLEQNNELYYYVEKDQDPLKIPTPDLTIKNLQLTQEYLHIFDGAQVHSFTLTKASGK